MVATHLPPTRGCIVLHWFTGTRSEARRAANLGCYLSVNGQMLRSSRHRDMVAALPLDRLLTETDAPFVRNHGRIVRPSDVAAMLGDLALLRGVSVEEMSAVIKANLHALVET
jgi:TatD DNase family protein